MKTTVGLAGVDSRTHRMRQAICALLLAGAGPAGADLYTHLQSPASGVSHALGTPIRIDFEANYQFDWGGNIAPSVGYGATTGGSGWTWVGGSSEGGGTFGADSQWYGTLTPADTGTWYFAGRLVSPPGDWNKTYYADGDWRNAEDSVLNAGSTLTVTNLPEPYDCYVTNSAGPESLAVGWTPRTYYVMVVRRLGDWPDPPANGTTYTNRQTYGADNRNFVVYAPGNGSSTIDRELISNTASNYYYSFYSENYSYYAAAQRRGHGRPHGTDQHARVPRRRDGGIVRLLHAPRHHSDLNKGTNWSGSWTWQNGTATIESGSLAPALNYPSAWGGKFHAGPNVTFWHGAYRDLRSALQRRLRVHRLRLPARRGRRQHVVRPVHLPGRVREGVHRRARRA
jgi:hypothetical protein